MRLQVNGEDYEIRVQQRTVTFCDIMKSGKLVSKGIAIQNPKDVAAGITTENLGARIAAGRALKFLDGQGKGFNVKAKTSEIVKKVQARATKNSDPSSDQNFRSETAYILQLTSELDEVDEAFRLLR